MNAVELARRALVTQGMRPDFLGRHNRKKVEFVTYPWQAGSELFVIIRRPRKLDSNGWKPGRVECVPADEVVPVNCQK
jgi:hypothetical protein